MTLFRLGLSVVICCVMSIVLSLVLSKVNCLYDKVSSCFFHLRDPLILLNAFLEGVGDNSVSALFQFVVASENVVG